MKKIIISILALIFLVVAGVFTRFALDKNIDYDVSSVNILIPTFDASYLDFEHKLNPAESLPFTASAAIDIDNDGTEELFIGGGPDQEDVFFKFSDGKFSLISTDLLSKPEIQDATFGASVIDVDKNGFSDLIISRTSGVWLYFNDGEQFSGEKLDLPIGEDTSPLSVAISDINRDGYFDMYVAGYIKKELAEGQNIFNQEGYGGTSVMLLNNGDNTFSDITKESGLHYVHNTFMAMFVDIDNDLLEDLVAVHDTGHVKTWKNMGDNKFVDIPNPNSNQFSYPMGLAVTDYMDDGYVDFFFSNVGTSAPAMLAKGDLRDDQLYHSDWIMLRNKGNFEFEDIAQKVKIANYEFSWGAIFEDFNLDGRDDLVVSENYIDFPVHKIPFLRLPGRFLLQTETGEFAARGKQSGVINSNYSITPLSADFNGDGYPDLVHINLAGPSKVFINRGGTQQYLKVKLPDTIESIAAKITVELSNGNVMQRNFVSGEGLGSDQSHIQIFGLGEASATKVTVQYINGIQQQREGTFKNELLSF
jgi:hypothetical protein